MFKRKTIPPRLKLKVLKRDQYRCMICARSPATHSELTLEVDHIEPVSKGGQNDLSNLQTLCNECNRGKGNDERLNFEQEERVNNLLDQINPKIRQQLHKVGTAKVVATSSEYADLVRATEKLETYRIRLIPNTIMGYQAGFALGIYTTNDDGGAKANFLIDRPV